MGGGGGGSQALRPSPACASLAHGRCRASVQTQTIDTILAQLEKGEVIARHEHRLAALDGAASPENLRLRSPSPQARSLRAAAAGEIGSVGYAQARRRRVEVEELIQSMIAEGKVEAWQETRLRTELEKAMEAEDDDPRLTRLLSA